MIAIALLCLTLGWFGHEGYLAWRDHRRMPLTWTSSDGKTKVRASAQYLIDIAATGKHVEAPENAKRARVQIETTDNNQSGEPNE